MRCGDAVVELWHRLGDPSDFNPGPCAVGTAILAAGMPLRDAINAAQDIVASWIVANVRRIRFRTLEDSFFFDSKVIDSSTLTVPSTFPAQVAPYRVLSLPSNVSGAQNRFANWVLTVGGEQHRVVRSYTDTGVDYIVLDAPVAVGASLVWTTTAVVLSQRIYAVDRGGVDDIIYGRRVIEMIDLIDLLQKTELSLAAGDEHFVATASTAMTPTMWSKRGGKVNFATAPTDVRSYEMRVIRCPIACVGVDDNYEIPDVWQQAMLLRAEMWGSGMLQEPSMAYAKKRDFVELMSQLRDEIDYESDYSQDFLRIRPR
jgi:hypothetical protein